MPRTTLPHIVVSSTGRRDFGYQAALAAQEHGRLSAFFTTLYHNPDNLTQKWLKRLPLPASIIAEGQKKLALRSMPGLATENIICNLTVEFFNYVAQLFHHNQDMADFFLRQNALLFDRGVARRLPQIPLDIFVFINNIAASYSLPMVKKLGGITILIATIPHALTRLSIIQEEIALHPGKYKPIHTPYMEDWFLRRNRMELGYADFIIAPTPFVYNSLVDHGIASEKIFLLARGNPVISSNNKFIPQKKINKRKFRLLYVGRVTWLKGIWYLIQAMNRFQQKDIELNIIGLCDDPSFLNQAGSNIKFISQVPYYEIANYYNNADVFVFPSLCEGSPTVVTEAMSHGLPVITTKNASGMVKDGKNGFVVQIRDIQALQEKILVLYDNPELRIIMGRNAKETAQSFGWQHFRQNLGMVFQHIYKHNCLPAKNNF